VFISAAPCSGGSYERSPCGARGGRAQIAGAAVALVVTGTLVYTLGGGWSPIDGFYFAVATLTTSSIADPELVLEDPWLELFTAFYVLIGIGILVEVARRLGISFIAVRRQDAEAKAANAAARAGEQPPE
jgi:hypothetical protein